MAIELTSPSCETGAAVGCAVITPLLQGGAEAQTNWFATAFPQPSNKIARSSMAQLLAKMSFRKTRQTSPLVLVVIIEHKFVEYQRQNSGAEGDGQRRERVLAP